MYEQRLPAVSGSIRGARTWIHTIAAALYPQLTDRAERLVEHLTTGAVRRTCTQELITLIATPLRVALRIEVRFRDLYASDQDWAAVNGLTTRFGAAMYAGVQHIWAELPAEPPLVPRLPLYDTWRDERGYHARLREVLSPQAIGFGCAQELRAETPQDLIRVAVQNQVKVWRWEHSWTVPELRA
jgi:hypothetical protein